MFRFVILIHDFPTPHFDFMLEANDPGENGTETIALNANPPLRTWRLTPPAGVAVSNISPANIDRCGVEQLPDHRRMYLDYEGPVSGNRGHVVRWDGGGVEWLMDTADCMSVQLAGDRIAGVVTLARSAGGKWNLEYQPADAGAT